MDHIPSLLHLPKEVIKIISESLNWMSCFNLKTCCKNMSTFVSITQSLVKEVNNGVEDKLNDIFGMSTSKVKQLLERDGAVIRGPLLLQKLLEIKSEEEDFCILFPKDKLYTFIHFVDDLFNTQNVNVGKCFYESKVSYSVGSNKLSIEQLFPQPYTLFPFINISCRIIEDYPKVKLGSIMDLSYKTLNPTLHLFENTKDVVRQINAYIKLGFTLDSSVKFNRKTYHLFGVYNDYTFTVKKCNNVNTYTYDLTSGKNYLNVSEKTSVKLEFYRAEKTAKNLKPCDPDTCPFVLFCNKRKHFHVVDKYKKHLILLKRKSVGYIGQ